MIFQRFSLNLTCAFHYNSYKFKLFKPVRNDIPEWKLINESKTCMDPVDESSIIKLYAHSSKINGTDETTRKILSIKYKKKIYLDEMVSKIQKHRNDYSSHEAKTQIRRGMEHVQDIPNDKRSRHFMHLKVHRRRKLLNELRETNTKSYKSVCETLGITWQPSVFPAYETYFNKAIREANQRSEDIIHAKMAEYKAELDGQKEAFFGRKNKIMRELDHIENELKAGNFDVLKLTSTASDKNSIEGNKEQSNIDTANTTNQKLSGTS